MTDILNQIDNIELQEIDVEDDNNSALLDKYKIRTIPTIVILNEDESIKETFKGIVSKELIEYAVKGEQFQGSVY
jgi:thiol-disulfide isomerase/thioredoxin